MKTWVKVALGVLAGLIVLLVLNAVVVSNQTRDAEVTVDGAELVDTSHGTIQVLDEGPETGEPIVLIHGYAGSIHWWEELTPLLSRDHRVISVDMLGHGGSEKPKSGYGMGDMSAALAEALAKLGVADATVVGHSLGGAVAVAVAETSPELVSRVAIVDEAPDDSYGDLSFSAKLGRTPVIGQAMKRVSDIAPTSSIRSQFEQAFAPGFNMASGFDNPDQVVEDLQDMTYTSFVDILDEKSEYTDSLGLDERLAGLEIPVLVVFGEEDQIYDAEESIEPYEDIPGVQAYVLEGAGHSPQVEIPDELAPLIAKFAATPTAAEVAEAKAATGKAAAAEKATEKKKKAEAKEPGKKKAGKAG